jgi:hypothetical protein
MLIAILFEVKYYIKVEVDQIFAIKMYLRYVDKEPLSNLMVQFSINMPRHQWIVKSTEILSWDIFKIMNAND